MPSADGERSPRVRSHRPFIERLLVQEDGMTEWILPKRLSGRWTLNVSVASGCLLGRNRLDELCAGFECSLDNDFATLSRNQCAQLVELPAPKRLLISIAGGVSTSDGPVGPDHSHLEPRRVGGRSELNRVVFHARLADYQAPVPSPNCCHCLADLVPQGRQAA